MEDEELQIQVGLLATRTGVELRTINAIIVGLRESTGLTGALGVPGEETFVDAIARLDGLIAASTDIDDAVTSSQTAWSSYKTDLEIATAIADLVGTAPDLLNTLEEIAQLVTDETGVLDAVEALVATNATAIADETAARIAADSTHSTDIATNATAIADETTARIAADSTHSADIATNAAGIATNAADIATARTDFEAADTSLDGRMTTAESDIVSLESGGKPLLFVSSLKDGGGSISAEMLAAIATGVDRIQVDSHYPSIKYGRATYIVGDAHGSPDGYLTINAGGKGLTLNIIDNELYSGCWGIKGDGSNEQTKIQAWSDYATSIALSTNVMTLVAEGGDLGVVNVTFGANCRVHMRKSARFIGLVNDVSFDAARPCVLIGSPTTMTTSVGDLTKRLSFNCSFHRGLAQKGAVGVRIVNQTRNTIGLGNLAGCDSPIQFAGSGDGNYFGYNIIYRGIISYGRFLSSFYSQRLPGDVSSSSGWVNENTWIKPNFQATSSMNNEGSSFAVRFVSDENSYTGQNNNVLISPSFEMGDSNGGYIGGASINEFQRFSAEGREYQADSAMTVPVTPPVHTSGSVGGVTYVGEYYRTPIFHDGAGHDLSIRDCRWEGGFGPFLRVSLSRATPSARAGENATVSVVYYGSVTERPGQLSDIEAAPKEQYIALNGEIKRSSRETKNNPTIQLKGIDKTLIYSTETSGWHSNRFPITTLEGPRGVGLSSILPHNLRLCVDGVRSTSIYCNIGFLLISGKHTLFRVTVGKIKTGYDVRARVHALNKTGTAINQTDINNTDVTLGSQASITSNSLSHPSATNSQFLVGVKSLSVDALLTLSGYPLRDLTIEAVPNSLDVGDDFMKPWALDSRVFEANEQRASNGTPSYGWFERPGEIITTVKTADSRRWIIDHPGVAAPPWATATVVYEGELKTNGANTYSAKAAGTTGATAPTHSSGTVTDGSVEWAWLAKTPTIIEYGSFGAGV